MGQGFIKKNGGKLASGKYEQLVNYLMLYDHGDECKVVTGGWDNMYNHTHIWWEGFNKKGTLEDNHLYVSHYSSSGNSYTNRGFVSLRTANKVNIDGYNGLYFDAEITSAGHDGCIYFGTVAVTGDDDDDTYLPTCVKYEGTTFGRKFTKVDNASSNHYVVVMGGVNYTNFTCKCYSVFLTRADNWDELASVAGLTATDISVLLEKSSTILTNKDAVDFMIAQCTGDFMVKAVQNSTFMKALASSPYKEKVYANEHWAKFLAMVS